MPEINDRKLYLGPRLRMLRRELGINQTRMAEELGVSASYLNHLERNQRPLTAQMLLRLANTYDIDVRDFVAGASEAAASSLSELFTDAIVRDIGIPRHELTEVAENYPGITEAITRLYRAVVDLRRMPDMLQHAGSGGPAPGSPLDWLREHLDVRHNHFAEIDAAAEAVAAGLAADPADLYLDLRAWLAEHARISVQVVPDTLLAGGLRHYDFHRRRLMLSERLPYPSRLFALAYHLSLVEFDGLLTDAITRAGAPDQETRALLRIALTNYAAAAIVMPYERFRVAAEETRHDLPLLEARFGASYEQVAHRLTTLGRSGARGIPFFMLKVDPAGIISKRFAGDAFPFARFGGACPRWNVHMAFRIPGRIITQRIETPDGKRYFTLSRAVARVGSPNARSLVAIGLGCEDKHAERLMLADAQTSGRAEPTTVGPTCQLCERAACPDRAVPPITRALALNPYQRPIAPYPFRPT